MKKSILTKGLLTTMALSFCMTGAMAALSSDADYQLNLAEYEKITTTQTPTPSSVTFGDNYSTITIDNALTGQFTVITNKTSKLFYLQATCKAGAGTANALYSNGDDPTKLRLVFTNETATGVDVPAATAVTDITGGSPVAANNKNAIAFDIVAPTITHDITPSGGITPAWDSTKNQVIYTQKNGTGVYTYTIAAETQAIPNTFSLHDQDGTYKATLTMTDASL